jgi:hypothetical protein
VKTFTCACGNTLHFENSRCLVCGRTLGYLPGPGTLSALEPGNDDAWRALADGGIYRQCANYRDYQVCNWMVPVADGHSYCVSCRLNHIIPDLSQPQNLTLWHRIETAKRRLLYTLYGLGLPVVGRDVDPKRGLAFEFLADPENGNEFSNEVTAGKRVVTGHRSGMVTINIAEAEHSSREEMRAKMKERYRTLLGHFRHECGHYYWDRLVLHTPWLERARSLFGDERADYQQALSRYYANGPRPGWQQSFISAYASAHPWEDWAETWAHYLHMVDTLETAHDFGFCLQGRELNEPVPAAQNASGYRSPADFDALVEDFAQLSVALNALNRSMGQPDAYPFVLSAIPLAKLRFVHEVIAASV